MSYHIKDLDYLRRGWQKVVDCGQYGSTLYVFRADATQIMAVTNKNMGIGTLIETISATAPLTDPQPIVGAHGLGENRPMEYATPSGDGTKL